MTATPPPSTWTRILNPGPVVLVSTLGPAGPNLCTVAWSMPLTKDPPRFVLRLGEGHLSFANAQHSGELVIALPSAELAPQVLLCGRSSGRDGDKWAASGLSPCEVPGFRTAGVAECCANFGCRVTEHTAEGLLVLAAEALVAAPGLLRDDSTLDVERYPLLHHLGGERFYASGSPHSVTPGRRGAPAER